MLEIAYPKTTKLDKSYNVQYNFSIISAMTLECACYRAPGPKAATRIRQDGIKFFQQIDLMMDPIPVKVSQNVTNKSYLVQFQRKKIHFGLPWGDQP